MREQKIEKKKRKIEEIFMLICSSNEREIIENLNHDREKNEIFAFEKNLFSKINESKLSLCERAFLCVCVCYARKEIFF
jgi:hypothetical protein